MPGYLSAIYSGTYIRSAQRFPEARRLTPPDIEALEMFDDLANDAELRLDMEFRPGDMQFLHNHTCLHDRTAFVDWPEPERKRHLLRLWLAAPGARPLPPVYRRALRQHHNRRPRRHHLPEYQAARAAGAGIASVAGRFQPHPQQRRDRLGREAVEKPGGGSNSGGAAARHDMGEFPAQRATLPFGPVKVPASLHRDAVTAEPQTCPPHDPAAR